MKKLSLMEVVEGIEDIRRNRSVMYLLREVLIIILYVSLYTMKKLLESENYCKSVEKGHGRIEIREDKSRARKNNSAENFNVIRHIAYNILKSETSFKGGITDKQFKCLLDSSYLDKIVLNWICS